MPEFTFLKRKADTLFGADGYTWSVCAASSGQFNLAPISIQMGGHVQVGLEDNIYLRKGVLAKVQRPQLVEKARAHGGRHGTDRRDALRHPPNPEPQEAGQGSVLRFHA